MATTGMLTGNPLTVKRWADKGFIDMYKAHKFGHMFNVGSIFQAEELTGTKGDEITYDFTGILTGIGTGEGGTMVGNEEALNLSNYTMKTNVFRHAVNNPNDDTIEQARTKVPFEKRARALLPKFMGSRFEASAFNQLAGITTTTITVDTTVYTGANRTFVQGLNTVSAPTINRIIRSGAAATDQALTSTDTMTLDLIDDALVLALTTFPTIEPLDGEMFDLYLSHQQVRDLKRDTTGKIQWYINYTSEMEGGRTGSDNPITGVNGYMNKPMGQYAAVRIWSSNYVSEGQNSSTAAAISTVRRGVLVGKNALSFGSYFGNLTDGAVPLKFSAQLQDYDYFKGIEAKMIYGLKKVVFQGEDYGSIVISTFAA